MLRWPCATLAIRRLFYEGSGASVTGSSVEGAKGSASVAQNFGGDARFLAAITLVLYIGRPKVDRPDVIEALKEPDVVKAVEEAAKSSDPALARAASEVLRFIRAKK